MCFLHTNRNIVKSFESTSFTNNSKDDFFREIKRGIKKMAESEGFDTSTAGAVSRAVPAAGNPLKKSRALRILRQSALGIKKKEQNASLACEFALCFMP